MSTINTVSPQGLDVSAAQERPREISRTVEYWLQTVIWTAIAMGVCVIGYCIEKYGTNLRSLELPRMFGNPAELPMRIFGLPHFIVALFFMLSSRRMRTVKSWVWFFGLLGMGLCFAWVFARFGAHKNPVVLIGFYFYFLIHGFRDEAYFYQTSGDCPADAARPHANVMLVLQAMLLMLLFAFLMPTYLLYVDVIKHKLPVNDPVLSIFFPASVPFLIKFACYLLPAIVGSSLLLAWLNRRYPGGWRAIWRDHHPLLVVFLASTGIVLATLLVGAWTFNFVVLAHFVGWYLFALRKMRTVPVEARATPREPLRWMRTTAAGFKTLHLGLALVATILIAISVYVFRCEDRLDTFVGGASFYYWTVLHVSLSFYPR